MGDRPFVASAVLSAGYTERIGVTGIITFDVMVTRSRDTRAGEWLVFMDGDDEDGNQYEFVGRMAIAADASEAESEFGRDTAGRAAPVRARLVSANAIVWSPYHDRVSESCAECCDFAIPYARVLSSALGRTVDVGTCVAIARSGAEAQDVLETVRAMTENASAATIQRYWRWWSYHRRRRCVSARAMRSSNVKPHEFKRMSPVDRFCAWLP